MTTLVVIEAPGKIGTFEAILKNLRIEGEVQATKGHLYNMPGSLHPLGIDEKFYEYNRELSDPTILSFMREKALRADRLYIATDADPEGDAIAWDVAELLKDIHPEPLRVKLRGMDSESVSEAIDNATPINKEDAIPARTRAIVDRMVGHSFSNNGVAVGRIGTALLGLVRDHKPSVHRLKLSAPATDGGRPWLAEIDVKSPLTLDLANKLADIKLPALSMKQDKAGDHPTPHMGDVMVSAGDQLDMSPQEAETSMQRLYESGRLSYPRSGSRGMSSSVSKRLQDIIRKAGYKYDSDNVPEKSATETHDAPHPIGKIDIKQNPEKLGDDEGVRTLIGRNLVRSGQKTTRQTADAKKLQACLSDNKIPQKVIDLVLALDWRRDHGPRFPGQETWPESEIVQRRADSVLLEAAIEAGLGRPSTWAKHIDTFIQRGLVDDDLNLTQKGHAWLQASPDELTNVRMSVAIENACEQTNIVALNTTDREPWEVLAERIVKALPEPTRKPMITAANATSAQPRRSYGDDLALVANENTLRQVSSGGSHQTMDHENNVEHDEQELRNII